MGGCAVVNTLLYAVGSVFFIPASLFFHPAFTGDAYYESATVMLIIGSALFTAAPCQSWWDHYCRLRHYRRRRRTTPQQPMLGSSSIGSDEEGSEDDDLDDVDPSLDDLAVSLVRDTVAVLGGVLFIIGSAAFWPTFGRSGVVVGNWMYRCGSAWGLLSSLWGLLRTFVLVPKSLSASSRWALRVLLVCGCLGSIGFLVGGAFFLAGDHNAEGSISWMLGSFAFLLSSLCAFIL